MYLKVGGGQSQRTTNTRSPADLTFQLNLCGSSGHFPRDGSTTLRDEQHGLILTCIFNVSIYGTACSKKWITHVSTYIYSLAAKYEISDFFISCCDFNIEDRSLLEKNSPCADAVLNAFSTGRDHSVHTLCIFTLRERQADKKTTLHSAAFIPKPEHRMDQPKNFRLVHRKTLGEYHAK
jgi:hypothetical protein